MSVTHHCLHCAKPIPANAATVCACPSTPGVHIVCASCLERGPSIASPLNRERLRHTARTRGAELIQQAARGNA